MGFGLGSRPAGTSDASIGCSIHRFSRASVIGARPHYGYPGCVNAHRALLHLRRRCRRDSTFVQLPDWSDAELVAVENRVVDVGSSTGRVAQR